MNFNKIYTPHESGASSHKFPEELRHCKRITRVETHCDYIFGNMSELLRVHDLLNI